MFTYWVSLFCNGFTLGPAAQATLVYLWRKVVCFVFVLMRTIKLGCFRLCYWCLWKALNEEGCIGLALFHQVLTCGAKVLEYWMISSLQIKLNHRWTLRRNLNVPLVLLERSWWAGFKRIYLIRFGFRMWEILIFKWFLPLKIQINSKKPGFERKISWGRGDTWANSTGHTSHFELKTIFHM